MENKLFVEIRVTESLFREHYDAPQCDEQSYETKWFTPANSILKLVLRYIFEQPPHSTEPPVYIYSTRWKYGQSFEWVVDKRQPIGLGYDQITGGVAEMKITIIDDNAEPEILYHWRDEPKKTIALAKAGIFRIKKSGGIFEDISHYAGVVEFLAPDGNTYSYNSGTISIVKNADGYETYSQVSDYTGPATPENIWQHITENA